MKYSIIRRYPKTTRKGQFSFRVRQVMIKSWRSQNPPKSESNINCVYQSELNMINTRKKYATNKKETIKSLLKLSPETSSLYRIDTEHTEQSRFI